MPKKTWFQHDFNASQKEKFAGLISAGGFEAYGRAWAFAELWYFMQFHKADYQETLRINERTLMKHLQMNAKSLPKLLDMFHQTLGIVFHKLHKTYGNVYETTWDKSLNFIHNRNGKFDNKNKNKKKKENKKEKEKKNKTKFTYDEYLSYLNSEFEKIQQDQEWLKKQEKDFPDVDILATINRVKEYWESKKAYIKKKRGDPDWKRTLRNGFYDDWRCIKKGSKDGKTNPGKWANKNRNGNKS